MAVRQPYNNWLRDLPIPTFLELMPEPLSSTLLQAIYCSAQAAAHAWLFMAFRQLYVDFRLDIGIQESSHNVCVAGANQNELQRRGTS